MGSSSAGLGGARGVDAAYWVLGVRPEASREEVRHAYRELLRRFHPDTNGGDRTAEERLREVQAAYEKIGREHAASGARDQAWSSAPPPRMSPRSAADVVRAQLRGAYAAGIAPEAPRVLDVRVR